MIANKGEKKKTALGAIYPTVSLFFIFFNFLTPGSHQYLINGKLTLTNIELADLYIFTQEIGTGRCLKEPSPVFSSFFNHVKILVQFCITWEAAFEIVVVRPPETAKASPGQSKIM